MLRRGSEVSDRRLALRVSVIEAENLTTVRVDGRLGDDGVPGLGDACRLAKRPLVLDLTNLMGSGAAGISLLRELAAGGVQLRGASPYVALLLAGTTPRPPGKSTSLRLGPQAPQHRGPEPKKP